MMELLLLAAAAGVTADAPTTTTNFAQFFSDTDSVYSKACATDSSGNAYIAGSDGTYGTILKCDQYGALTWGRLYSDGTLYAVAVDTSGNVYCAGAKGSILKYNSAGVLQWKRSLGISGIPTVTLSGIAVDTDGNVYVTGYSVYIVGVVAKYDSSGTIQWQRSLTSTQCQPAAIAVDSSGVYLCGRYLSSSSDNLRLIVVKYDLTGAIQWQRKGTASPTYALGIALDGSSNVYVAGSGHSSSPGGSSVLIKYDSSGAIQWQRKLEAPLYAACVTFYDGNLYMAGGRQSSPYSAFIAKYNTSGTIQWHRLLAVGDESGTILSANGIGVGARVHVAGDLTNTNDYGFLASLMPDGTLTGTHGIWTYSNPEYTESAAGMTDAGGDLTDAAGGFAAATGLGDDLAIAPTRTQQAFT